MDRRTVGQMKRQTDMQPESDGVRDMWSHEPNVEFMYPTNSYDNPIHFKIVQVSKDNSEIPRSVSNVKL